MKEPNLIDIKDVCKSYRKETILSNVNLHVTKNEIVGLVGINGVGKTTIIKIIMGLINNYSGEAKVYGLNPSNPLSRTDIFYLPEKFAPMLQMTGYEFIRLSSFFYKINSQHEKMLQACDSLKFPADKLNNKISSFSKGMIQKIGLMAMILSNTELWVLDEPMSGLDPIARYELKNILLKHKDNGGTILFTSHQLQDVEEIADNIIVIHDKKICFSGNLNSFILKHDQDSIEKSYFKAINYA